MGAAASKGGAAGGPLADLKHAWVLKYADSESIKYASDCSLAVIKASSGDKVLALAYQASSAAHEGSRGQHLRFALSKDGGETWGDSKCVMFGAAPLWGPSLH